MSLRLLDQLARHAREIPDTTAVREVNADKGSERLLTFGQWKDQTELFASYLRQHLSSGSVVILCCLNTLDFHVAFTAILQAGCVAFPISPDAAEPELRTLAERTHALAVIGIQRATDALSHLIQVPIPLLRPQGTDGERHAVPSMTLYDQEHAGLRLQSSGTTGHPKIACRSGRSLDAVSENMCQSIGFTEADRVLAMIPLCHSYGLEHGLLAPLWAGSTVHLCKGFDPHLVHQQLATAGITVLPGVPPIYEMLNQFSSSGLCPTLRVAYSAGSPLPPTVFQAAKRGLGWQIGQLYGATEIGSVTFGDPASKCFNSSSVGKPMNGVEIRIANSNTLSTNGESSESNEGEILVRAPSMFDGYEGEDSLKTSDGFFPTGDLGYVDFHGNLVLTGRLKLLIDIGGLKVNPIEVESVLLQHPAVHSCVVVATSLSETVFRLKAIVTPREHVKTPSIDELRRFARERLSSYKVPRVFEFRPSLPRSPTGKILRHLVEA
jgi:long-chain acyl-CoA synthetase